VQLGIDSEGNDMEHRFMVEEISTSGRMALTVAEWWMLPRFYNPGHGGPLPDFVVEKGSYFESLRDGIAYHGDDRRSPSL
jgi:hypothetical protein